MGGIIRVIIEFLYLAFGLLLGIVISIIQAIMDWFGGV